MLLCQQKIKVKLLKLFYYRLDKLIRRVQMKQKLLKMLIGVAILGSIIGLIPNAFATYEVPVRLKMIYGYDDLTFMETTDRVYISAYDSIEFDQLMLYRIGPKIYQFDSLYETFVVEELETGDILYEKIGRDSIIFDAYNYMYDVPITFSSADEEVTIDFGTNFVMYFVKTKDYSKLDKDITLVVDVDNPIYINDLNSLFGAFDNYDGNVTDNIEVVEDGYSENMNKPGVYTVKIRATDSSNNGTNLTYTVWVKDTLAPVVEPLEPIYISYTQSLDIETLPDLVVATDNYTEHLDIYLYDENYIGNESKIGQYFVEIYVDDLNGNTTSVIQEIHVIDDVAPVISGKNDHFLEVENIIRPYDVLANVTAVDEVDEGPIDVYIISHDYVRHVVGTFVFVLGAKDASGNEATYEVTVRVLDSTSPEFYIKIPQITLDQSHVHNANELLDLIKSMLTIQYEHIEIIHNEYEGNENKPGVYRINLSANTGTNTVLIETLIRVNEAPPTSTDITNKPSDNYIKVIWISLSIAVVCSGIGLFVMNKLKKSKRLK